MKPFIAISSLLLIATTTFAYDGVSSAQSGSNSSSGSETASGISVTITDCTSMMGMERNNCMSANTRACNGLVGDSKKECNKNVNNMNSVVSNGGRSVGSNARTTQFVQEDGSNKTTGSNSSITNTQ